MPVTTNTYPIHTTHISQKIFFCEAGTLVWINSLSFTFSIFSSLCNGYAYDFYWKRNKERGLLNKDGSCKFSRNSSETQLCGSIASLVSDNDCVSGYEHAGATGDKWVDMELDLFAEGFAEVMSSDAAISELNKISIINETKKSSSF